MKYDKICIKDKINTNKKIVLVNIKCKVIWKVIGKNEFVFCQYQTNSLVVEIHIYCNESGNTSYFLNIR